MSNLDFNFQISFTTIDRYSDTLVAFLRLLPYLPGLLFGDKAKQVTSTGPCLSGETRRVVERRNGGTRKSSLRSL